MDIALIAILTATVAAALLLRPRDLIPMTINLVLIIGGTVALLWMLTNPQEARALQERVTRDGISMGWQLLLFLACQPLIFIVAKWLAKRLPKHKA